MAPEITRDHSLDFGLGDSSPLAKVYQREGWILLIGVGHENNTSLHLAEFRAAYSGKKEVKQGAPLNVKGERRWIELRDFEDHSEDDFEEIGSSYLAAGGTVLGGKIGQADSVLIPQVELVDFAVDWMEKNRSFG
jgi:aminoglycoside 3-N-acetyltransferase